MEGLVYLLEPAVAEIEWVDRLLKGNPIDMREISAEMRYNLETYLDTNAAMAENKTAFYAGRCIGSALVIAGMHKAGSGASANGSGGSLSSGGNMVLVTPDGRYINAGGSAELVLPPGVLAGDAPLGDWKSQIKESRKNQEESKSEREVREQGYKKPKSGTGKEKATDVPLWAKGNRPYKGESGKDFAKRLCDEYFGVGNYSTKGYSDYSRIRKWGDRGFE